MEISQLRYLVTVAEQGSFTQAARRLKLSQPSLSLAIKKLEDEVGQPLFDRLTRRVVPTAAGERMLETARRVLTDLDQTACEVRDLKGEVSGTLRIGAIPTIGPFVLPCAIAAFTAQYPGVELHITEDVTARLTTLLEEGELDVALVSTMTERPGLHLEPLTHEELLVICPPESSIARKKEIAWKDLEKERFLVLGEEHCLADQAAWFCRKNRVAGRTIMVGTQLSTIAAMVDRGLGVSLVPALMARECEGKHSFCRIADGPPVRQLFIAWSVLRYRPQAGRAFTKILKQQLGTSQTP